MVIISYLCRDLKGRYFAVDLARLYTVDLAS